MWFFSPTNGDLMAGITSLQIAVQNLGRLHTAFHISLSDRMILLESALARMEAKLNRLCMGQVVPGPLIISLTGESEMLRFQIQLPPLPPGPNDIVSGELNVVIDGVALPAISVDKNALVVEDASLVGRDNAAVSLDYRYVDDAGNRSQPSTLLVTLTDTISPTAPGMLGLVAVEEVFPDGPSGVTGPSGPTGAVGPTGASGPTGSGSQGLV